MRQLSREELHKYLIEVAAKSPCKKRKVGAVVVMHDGDYTADGIPTQYKLIAEGYNFNTTGGPCETTDGDTKESVIHAEAACIANISPFRIDQDELNLKMFVTHEPCMGCKAAILAAGITYEVMGDFLKFDSNKPRYDLIPTEALAALARVLTYGAKKYKPNNWRRTTEPERYIAAAMRHLEAYRSGELVDPESGPAQLKHLEQVLTNIAFLIALDHKPERLTNGHE